MDFAALYMSLNSMELGFDALLENKNVFMESGWALVEDFFNEGFIAIVSIKIVFHVIVFIFL